MGDETVHVSRPEVVSRVRRASELRSTVRVYRKEFLFDSRHETRHDAEMAVGTYRDRITPEDADVRVDPIRTRPFELWVRRWNVAGEYKDPIEAFLRAAHLHVAGLETQVVPRNSRAEHELRSYGVVKLVGA